MTDCLGSRMNDARSRRRFLAAVGATAGLAGCLGSVESGDGGNGSDGEDGGGDGNGGGGQSLADHPGAAELADQPRLGPDPAEATGVIVAFEDPSCTRCRAFERDTMPKIRSELVDSGDVAVVFRGYPVVYPWGKPATQALESTFARSADAHWALADHYFERQPEFDSDNVLSKTRAFLAAETDVDADAVVADAESKAHDDAVQADLAAGENADVDITPTLLLFRDGEYRTRATGSVSVDVVAGALGL